MLHDTCYKYFVSGLPEEEEAVAEALPELEQKIGDHFACWGQFYSIINSGALVTLVALVLFNLPATRLESDIIPEVCCLRENLL